VSADLAIAAYLPWLLAIGPIAGVLIVRILFDIW